MNTSEQVDHHKEPEDLPEVEVTEEEFVAMWEAVGASKERALFHLKACKIMKSQVRIGDKFVSLKKKKGE
jgi:hypothetical protein